MKKKVIGLVASLSIALGLSASAFSKNMGYEEKRVQQYKQFYKEYYDKDYRIRVAGKRVDLKEDKISDVLEIEHGNNLYDNKRGEFSDCYDSLLPRIDKNHFSYQGPDSNWYYCPYVPKRTREKAIPVEQAKEELSQVMKDVLTLPEDLQKNIFCVITYHSDGDSWIIMKSGTEAEEVRKMYDHLSKTDEARDAKQKERTGKIQPIIPTENQFLPMDVFFPPTRYVDADNDGKFDYAVDLYCTNGSWFNPDAEWGYVTVAQWFELDQNSENGRVRKYEKPFKITVDFDIGEEDEQPGHDIAFFDENHDGYFEKYNLLKGSKKE